MSPQVHEYEFRLLELNQAYSAEILGRAVLAIGAIGRAKDSAVSVKTSQALSEMISTAEP